MSSSTLESRDRMSSRRELATLVGLTMAFVLGTVIAGWPSVPIVSLLWGVVTRWRGAAGPGAVRTGIAAATSWALLLVWVGTQGPLDRVVATLAALVGVPGPVLVVITVLFPALLAWSVMAVVEEIGTGRKQKSR
jgi:hypothetical protein